jgi:hypothetical protein
MSNNLISPLQKFSPKDWSGLTTETQIFNMFGSNPVMLNDVLDNIYDVNLSLDLDRFIDQFPVLEIERDAPFEWMLNSQSAFKSIPIVQYYDSTMAAQPTNPGIANSTFYVEFVDRIFEAIDVIGTGYTEKEKYQLRITGDPKPNGSNWVYPVELMTGDPTLFMDTALLSAGNKYVKMGAYVEKTLSGRGSSSLSFSSPFRMQNVCSMIKKEYAVPGNMIDQKENAPLGFYFVDASGKRHMTWIGKLDYDFLVDFKRMKAMTCVWGISNKTAQNTYVNKGESGYHITAGAGLYQQIAPSNVHYYNTLDLDVVSAILMSLSVGKLPEDSRKFVFGSGEYGLLQLHKVIETKSVSYGPNRTESRITGKGFDMGYSGQFKRYAFINGIEIECMLIPFLDDVSLCDVAHPDGGILSSYEYLILDFGTQQGKPNIQKVQVKGVVDLFGYLPGMRDPFTPGGGAKPKMQVSKVDGYEVVRQSTVGLKVHNPMRIARMIPNL